MRTLMIHSKTYGDHQLLYDDEDENFVQRRTWYVMKQPKSDRYYCLTNILIGEILRKRLFHRLLLNITNPQILIDHINHNGLDNRRENLRECNGTQNLGNQRLQKGRSSIYKGVSYKSRRSHLPTPWRAQIKINRNDIYLGYFSSEKEAAITYNNAALEYFGEFAFLNDLEG